MDTIATCAIKAANHVCVKRTQLARTMRQLSPSLSEREMAAVQELTNRLMNKLLHYSNATFKRCRCGWSGAYLC
ncbi:hypothetical protein [Dictyobacter vulcani]|uniref:hypothetical protein n=1 Tax=Dictyobacter vulcani TaxID=2607529 RepID=UPI0035306104